MGAADVVEVDVDAIGGGLGECRAVVVGRFVVDRGIETEVFSQPVGLFVGARKANDVTAVELRNLADDRADRPSSTGDDDCLAGFGFADLKQAEVGRATGHPEGPQVGWLVGDRGIDRRNLVGIQEAVLAPASLAGDEIALAVGLAVALDDLADDATF